MTRLHGHKFFRRFALNPRRYVLQGLIFLVAVAVIFCIAYFVVPALFETRYEGVKTFSTIATSTSQKKESGFVATHVPTPAAVKAIYMTSCVAGTKNLRNGLAKLIDETELNAIVIDIKDFSGALSFIPKDPALKDFLSTSCYAPDMAVFVDSLHKKGIYVIGRITVFQDPFLAKRRPDLAVKKKSDGTMWKDYKGISFTDPGAKEVWEHTIAIAKESYDIGFDELNFDYVRFPSDGPMSDIDFTWSGTRPKSDVLETFFAYLSRELKPTGAVLSADLFGMTTTNTDDLNIGQVLEKTLPYFDYVSPMVYPSHYPKNFMGFANPAAKPYEVVKFSMDTAVKRTVATTTVIALFGEQPISTSTKPFIYKKPVFSQLKLRPWLQDFNLGATYTAEMVDKQIQATYDAGLDSWLLWNASNRYTAAALKSVSVPLSAHD